MVMLRAFRPLRYNPEVIGDLARVIAPPYDVISERHRDALYDRDTHNVIRLELGREADRYASAARHIEEWVAERVLIEDQKPVLAYYAETYRLADGSEHERRGIFGTVRLEHFEGGQIRPHERTFPSAKEDRRLLLQATRTNLSPIFGLFAGGTDRLAAAATHADGRAADIDFRDEYGWRHRLWWLTDPALHAQLGAALAEETVYIADGHHRYETALGYSEERNQAGASPDGGHNFVLMYLTSMREPGLLVMPTHRVFHRLPLPVRDLRRRLAAHFRVVDFDASARGELAGFLASQKDPCFGLVYEDGGSAVVMEDSSVFDHLGSETPEVLRSLDVSVLDSLVVRGMLGIEPKQAQVAGDLSYTHTEEEAVAAVDAGAPVAFLMNPPSLDDVVRVCQAGEVMPQKSTYFFPKLSTGLMFHRFE